ncbi:MAG: PEGA domain-containing protein [Proteobacteria bacterium]|nr:PEGA domain-containing protein [Pseudomonadota bacterium]
MMSWFSIFWQVRYRGIMIGLLVGVLAHVFTTKLLLAQGQRSHTVLIVNSPMRQAQVLVNGILAGNVNQTITIRPGVHMIRIHHKDYYPYTQKLRAVPGRTHRMQVNLKRKPSQREIQAQQKRMQPSARGAAAQGAAVKAAPGMLAPSPSDRSIPPPQTYSRGGYYSASPQAPQAPQAPPPAYPVRSYYPAPPVPPPPATYSGYGQSSVRGTRSKSRARRKARSRKKKVVEEKKKLPLVAEPEPRDATDYMLSLLPLGLPQMRHGKPLFGGLLLLAQAGGVGGYFWFKYQADSATEFNKTDQTNRQNKINRETNSQRKQQLTTAKKQKKVQWEDYAAQQQLFAWISLGVGGAGYAFSVLEALAVGPKKPKTPAEMFSSQAPGAWDHHAMAYNPTTLRQWHNNSSQFMILSDDIADPLCDKDDPLYCMVMLGGDDIPVNIMSSSFSDSSSLSPFSVALDLVPGARSTSIVFSLHHVL